ncbi:TPA: MarR family transcriptional regulator, partial [Klebsiella pneumoniae]|nr:MarR family transcriptional regulator [Klebsiella pneumoniae]
AAVTESDPSVQYRQRPGGVNPMTNLFNQCLAGVRK